MSAAAFGKQGITPILSSDCDSPKAASLKRTLSADMSSRKWIAQSGPISSSEEHRLDDAVDSAVASREEEEAAEDGVSGSKSQYAIWNLIQEEKNKTDLKETRQSGIWSSILSQKTDQPVPAAPYIHPLAKRSARSLSEKSLQICTESLGSETGSDGFSSYPSSEASDGEEDKEEFIGLTERVVSSSSTLIDKKGHLQPLARSRSFPPPLPSLSRQNGASLHVRSHRDNGRLVLEAVSVKEQNKFRAQREDGRLVLTFIDDPSNDHDDSDEIAYGDENDGEETDDGFADVGAKDGEGDEDIKEKDMETEETGDAGEKMELLMEELPEPSSGEVRVNKFAILMNKRVVLAGGSPVLSDRLGEVVIFNDMEQETMKMQAPLSRLTRLAQVIPRQSTVTATSFSNVYGYLWRTESAVPTNPTAKQSIVIESHCSKYIISNEAPMSGERQELLVLRGNSADYLLPLIQNCKGTRRPLLFLGPRCIATS